MNSNGFDKLLNSPLPVTRASDIPQIGHPIATREALNFHIQVRGNHPSEPAFSVYREVRTAAYKFADSKGYLESLALRHRTWDNSFDLTTFFFEALK